MPHAGPALRPGRTIRFIDLFCGAGGTSTGAREACEDHGYGTRMVAVNHWDIAIETHSANHPEAEHYCCSIDNLDPTKVDLGGELDILFASPECTNHSIARGGMPINDQSRCTAWDAVKWVDKKRPKIFIFENVREFKDWGPLGSNGRPLKSQKGKTFQAWLEALRALGYKVDHRILCAADYGDPTTRRRLFVIGVRGRREIPWPEPTHSKEGRGGLFGLKPWVPARDIINWDIPGKSIYHRKKPLAEKTLRRILIGLQKYSGLPFILPHPRKNGDGPITTDAPMPTVTATSSDFCLAQPELKSFILPQHAGGRPVHPITDPISAITTTGAHAIASPKLKPFIVPQNQSNKPRSIDKPAPTVTTTSRGVGVAEPKLKPYLTTARGQSTAQSIDNPTPTVTGTGKGHIGVAKPYLVHVAHGNGNEPNADARRSSNIEAPVPAVTAGGGHIGVAQPKLTPILVSTAHSDNGGSGADRVKSIDEPHPTVNGNRGEFAVAQPSLSPIPLEPVIIPNEGVHGGNKPRSIKQPLNTVTAQRGAGHVAQAYLIPIDQKSSQDGSTPITSPVSTIVTKQRHGLCQPWLVKFYGTADAAPVDKPLGTVTAKERFGLANPTFTTPNSQLSIQEQPIVEINGQRYLLDIHFRMLTPRELASAQGFPRNYHFAGNATDTVKQIGNAVPKNLAKALTTAALKVL